MVQTKRQTALLASISSNLVAGPGCLHPIPLSIFESLPIKAYSVRAVPFLQCTFWIYFRFKSPGRYVRYRSYLMCPELNAIEGGLYRACLLPLICWACWADIFVHGQSRDSEEGAHAGERHYWKDQRSGSLSITSKRCRRLRSRAATQAGPCCLPAR